MRYPSTRLGVASSLTFFLVWMISSLVEAWALHLRNFGLASTLAGVAWSFYLPLLGFIGLMILGMAQHFVPLFAGRELWDNRVAMAQILLADLGVVLLLVLPRRWEAVGLTSWLAAAFLFVVLIVMTLRSKQLSARPMERRAEFRAVDRLAIPMTSASIFYLLAASVGFVLAALPRNPWIPPMSSYWFSFLHLYTLGFISLMVFGVGFHLLPRFLDVVPPCAAVKAILFLGVPSPAGVALTMPFLVSRDSLEFLFVVLAICEATAALLFAALVFILWRRSPKHRPASTFNAASGLWLAVGVVLAVLIGIAPQEYLIWAPAHGWINLLGFAGFSIFGITHEVLPPFASKGLRVTRTTTHAHFALAFLGLALIVASYDASFGGQATAADWTAIAGFGLLVAMAVSYVTGTLHTLFGIAPGRPAL